LRFAKDMDTDPIWAVALTLAVVGVLGVWFHRCGRAERSRRARAFGRRTFLYAGVGLVVGLAFLTSDFGPERPEARMGVIALTTCCFLLVYAAAWAVTAADDESLEFVNLTGRALLLTRAPELAPFYTLPAPHEEPATELPPMRPRTRYVVTAELGRRGAAAGRTDVFTVEAAASPDPGGGPLLVRRLVRALPADDSGERPESGIRW
jgi:hypothetical protein